MGGEYHLPSEPQGALDHSPFGCFEPVGLGVPPSALAGIGLSEAESLYKAFFDLKGWEPRQVDACEIWQLAVMLGAGRTDSRPTGGVLTGRALLAARLKAAAEGRPPPSISLVPTSMPDPSEGVT